MNIIQKFKCWNCHRKGYWVDWWCKWVDEDGSMHGSEGAYDAMDCRSAAEAFTEFIMTCHELMTYFTGMEKVCLEKYKIDLVDYEKKNPDGTAHRVEVRRKKWNNRFGQR